MSSRAGRKKSKNRGIVILSKTILKSILIEENRFWKIAIIESNRIENRHNNRMAIKSRIKLDFVYIKTKVSVCILRFPWSNCCTRRFPWSNVKKKCNIVKNRDYRIESNRKSPYRRIAIKIESAPKESILNRFSFQNRFPALPTPSPAPQRTSQPPPKLPAPTPGWTE